MKLEEKPQGSYTDQEINEFADWFAALTIEQLFFIKKSYEQMMTVQAKECGHEFVH